MLKKIILTGVLAAALSTGAAPGAEDVVVAVIDFDNTSGQHLPDIGLAAHELISTYLVGLPHVRTVTRDKLTAVLREQGLSREGLIGNKAKSTSFSRLLGADFMVTGSVIQYSTERRPYRGYGTSTLTVFHRMKVSMQLVDLGTAEMVFSKVYDLEAKDFYPDASSAPYDREDTGKDRDLLAQLVEQSSADLQAAVSRQAGTGQGQSTVRVRVTTEPSGADIEVNGVYVGSTPAEVALDPGIQAVALSLQGYEVWEKKVKVAPGLAVSVKLAPLPPESKITIENRQSPPN